MNILHNRFTGLWRQDLSQNVTTKEIEKRSRYSSLFFDIVWWSVCTFIRSRNGPNTYFPESFARSHQSLLTMSNPFISFTSLSVPEKQSVFFVGLSLLPESKSLQHHCHSHSNFSWAFLSKGERCMRLTLCEAPTHETRPDHNTGNFIPYSFR